MLESGANFCVTVSAMATEVKNYDVLSDEAVPVLPNPGPGLLPPPDPTAVTIFTALQEQLRPEARLRQRSS